LGAKEMYEYLLNNLFTGVFWWMSPWFGRGSGETVTGIIGQDKQVIVAWWLVCPAGLCCFLGVVSDAVIKVLSINPVLPGT
jgi:TM2 domain-containing membrane protein YozV